MFQSTHPRRVWQGNKLPTYHRNSFNPHTHAGCDIIQLSRNSYRMVSIHTPTQGVTDRHQSKGGMRMFQSTHPRRVWHQTNNQHYKHKLFQSTHPRRVWLWIKLRIASIESFNPHTHAGCDKRHRIWDEKELCFNPHTHAGCDSISNNIL